MRDLTCREVVDFLTDYLAGALHAEQRREFEAHLAECDDCLVYLSQYEQTVALGKAAFERPDEPAAGHVPAELVEAILAARRRRR
jgi:anti-sigma factor RsiW